MTTVLEELLDVPLYLNTHEMSKTLKCTPPKHELFRSALVNAGVFVWLVNPTLRRVLRSKISCRRRLVDFILCCGMSCVPS
jgi:hypothetical protein